MLVLVSRGQGSEKVFVAISSRMVLDLLPSFRSAKPARAYPTTHQKSIVLCYVAVLDGTMGLPE
jgi:hypothetical protein